MGRRRITSRKFEIGDREKLEDVIEPCNIKRDDSLKDNPSYTILEAETGKPLACGGIIIDDDGEGKCWLNLSKEAVDKYKFSLVQYIALHGAQIVSHYDIETLIAYVLPDLEEGKRLAEKFGFVCEGFIDGKLFYRKYNRSWVSFQD